MHRNDKSFRMYLVMTMISIAAIIVTGVMIGIVTTKYIGELNDAHQTEIQELENRHAEDIQSLENEINKRDRIISEKDSEFDEIFNEQLENSVKSEAELKGKIISLENQVNSLMDTLTAVEGTGEVDLSYIKKYSFLIDEIPSGSKITFKLMKFMDEQCKRWNIPVTMMWAIAKIESHYNTNSLNSSSGACGLGNVMPSTGKSFWENILGYGKGSFTSDMLYDPYVNVEIMCAHIGYYRDDGLYNTVDYYSGGGGDSYYNVLVGYCRDYGFNLSESTFYYGAD